MVAGCAAELMAILSPLYLMHTRCGNGRKPSNNEFASNIQKSKNSLYSLSLGLATGGKCH